MKTYKFYSPGTKVYAIARWYKDKKPTSYCSIFPAVCCGFSVDYNKKDNSEEHTYYLKTPDGDNWGDAVAANEVDTNFNKLANKMKKEWSKNANTH